MRLKNKVAIITGGTSGMGKATAILFAKEGAKVVICGRRSDLGEQIVKGIRNKNGDAVFIKADVSKEKVYKYQIQDNGTLTDKELFADMGSDGMTLDNEGNLYVTGDGVVVFDKEGNKIDHIQIDKDWTGNVTFGGANEDILFITASDAVYKLPMKTHGIRWNH